MKSIKSVLLCLLAVCLCAMGALAASAWWSGQQMQQQARKVFVAKDVTADILPPPMYLIEARLTLSRALEGTLAPPDAMRAFDKLAAEYRDRVGYWTAHPPFGLERELLGEQHATAQRFFEAGRTKVLQPLVDGQADAAREALAAVHLIYEAHRRAVDVTVQRSAAVAEENIAAFDTVEAAGLHGNLAVLAGSVLAGTGLFLLVWRRLQRDVARPLQQACEAAGRIATGDLAGRIVVQGRDEAVQVLQALDAMQQGLRRVVDEVRDGVDGIAIASAQIAQGNADLSERTEQQAGSLQQTASAMHEIDAHVRSSADHAQQADRAAALTVSAAGRGGEVVAQVVQTMDGIADASQRIAAIVGVIDGIAFQTNILALNAAVEAARSGEHGRGFSVVAGEVRALAHRSAEAAREIKGLIAASSERIDAGSRLAREAGTTMADIVAQVGGVTALIGRISGAAHQQAQGIGEVNVAVDRIDGMTQQNAALVEESAAAAESLKLQAQHLAGAVAVFRLAA